VVDRVGVSVGRVVFDGAGVVVGVRRGVYDGLAGRTGVAEEAAGASSLAVVTDVIGFSWLVVLDAPV